MKNTSHLKFFIAACGWLNLCAGAGFSQEMPGTSPGYSLGDPKNQIPPPGYAVGFGSRDPDKDYYPEFKTPPPGYGNVPFFWWLGDPLTRERLTWQLEQFRGMKTSGLQVNYAHSDKGGQLWGFTYASEPPLFSQSWWELYGWFMGEAKKQGMAVSLSDYTLGISQGWKWDEAIRDYPEIIGGTLEYSVRDCTPEGAQPEDGLAEGEFLLGDENDPDAPYISAAVIGGKLHTVRCQQRNPSLDPMHPKSGAAVIEKFFQPFLEHNPGEGGRGINFFFSDELDFRVHGRLWDVYFAEEFRKMKGYDIRPVLAALFTDVGPRTVKVRLDYYDVLVELSERNYFKPVFDWHQKHGMIYGCDHGGRGLDVAEFGDYFRTQRWNQGPGSDQPGLARHLVKAKVSASQAHLYERPRVWLEGFHSSGWGTNLEGLTDATFANFVMGYNLLSLHGLYYSTKGGWWEWAPPCNHWRNPDWKHQRVYFEAAERLAYLLTQGVHAADVAVLYPVAPAQAGVDAGQAVDVAFQACNAFYGAGVDMDFIDFQSVDRAEIKDGRLHVSGEAYRVLVLPHMRVIRHSTLQKAAAFARAGGIVVTLGAVPECSDRVGAGDPEVVRLTAELPEKWRFPATKNDVHATVNQAVAAVKQAFTQDIQVKDGRAEYFAHRKVGARDVYVLFQVPANAEMLVRATGRAELWDVWTGARTPVASEIIFADDAEKTPLSRVKLQNDPADLIILALTPGEENLRAADGDKNADEGKKADYVPRQQTLGERGWECAYLPTLDNTWGDFRWPVTRNTSAAPKIGPEARRFMFHFQDADGNVAEDGVPQRYTYEFGPKFRQLGPLSVPRSGAAGDAGEASTELAAFEQKLAEIMAFPVTADFRGQRLAWTNYDFSWRWGVEGDPGHQGYHGLKENMYDIFIRLGKFENQGHLQTGRRAEFTPDPGEQTAYYLWSMVVAEKAGEGVILTHGMKPARAWVNGKPLLSGASRVALTPGANPVLLKYDGPGIGYFLIVTPESLFAEEAADAGADGMMNADAGKIFADATRWVWTQPGEGPSRGLFRSMLVLDAVPKFAEFRITADDAYTLYVNGTRVGGGSSWTEVRKYDISPFLKPGKNVIAVDAVNEAGPRGWIGELRTDGKTLAGTDAGWRCVTVTGKTPPNWEKPDFDAGAWQPAAELSNFEESLWAKHQNGPPILGPVVGAVKLGEAVDIHETTGTLAMRWTEQMNALGGLRPGVYAYDVRGGKQVTGVYDVPLAPGTAGVEMTLRGGVKPVAAALDGVAFPLSDVNMTKIGDAGLRITLPKTVEAGGVLRLEIPQKPGFYAGEMVPEPISFVTRTGRMMLGDWTQQPGLECYSGGVLYRRTFTLDAGWERAKGRPIYLKADALNSSAEVRVNGKSAGVRIKSPWRWDITYLLTDGENTVEMEVYNTLAPHYLTIPTHYRGDTRSGILGNVWLTTER